MKSSLDYIAAIQSIGTSFALCEISSESAFFILNSIINAAEIEMKAVREAIIDAGGTQRLKVVPVKRWEYPEPSLVNAKKLYDTERKRLEALMITAAERGEPEIVDHTTGQCLCAATLSLSHRINVI